MTYKLALRLKNAGFPVKICGKCEGTGEDNGWNFISENFGQCPRCIRMGFITPTLSELIEACGDGFNMLSRPTGKGNENSFKWNAWSYGDFKPRADGQGGTPEEAMANLWLKLNEKI